jgi:hypothetical protein
MADPVRDGPVAEASGATDEWFHHLAEAVEEQGILETWEAHFAEIVRPSRDGQAPDRMLGPSLLQLLMHDADLGAYLRTLPAGSPTQPGPPTTSTTPGGEGPHGESGAARGLDPRDPSQAHRGPNSRPPRQEIRADRREKN